MKELWAQKITQKYFWKECLAKLGAPSQVRDTCIKGRVRNGRNLTADKFCLYEFQI